MGKGVSKNQRSKKEVITKTKLDPRNWQGSTISSWVQVYAETEAQAEQMIRKALEVPKGDINLKYIGN
jgi:hypothetical protein